MANLAIIGSRSFNNFSFAKNEIIEILKENNIKLSKIISGGASGADNIAEQFANKYNIPIEIIKPNWKLGKHAGILRNTEIIEKSDIIIAFWDQKSKGTLDSIKKAQKLNKPLYIVDISNNRLIEGVRIDNDDSFIFDFKNDEKDDILKLKYNKKYITKKKSKNIYSYYSYKLNKNIDKSIRFKLIDYIKSSLEKDNKYENFLNKAVIGLFNNPYFELSDIDLILIPESSSNLNLSIANKIKNKIPNALFLKDIILKNEIENIQLDYDKLKQNNLKQTTIFAMETLLKKAIVDNKFRIKKIPPKFRKYIINFLKIDINNKMLLNKLYNGKILIVDDLQTEGTTFKEIERLIQKYSPKEIILYSLIG